MKNAKEDLGNKDFYAKATEMQKRTLTALLLLPFTAAIIYFGGTIFSAAIVVVMLIMFYEFAKMHTLIIYPVLLGFSVLLSILCCASMLYLRELNNGLFVISWLVCVIAATDIGAFFTGRAIGKHKIWPRVSPNKTWEGAIGGFALAAAVSVAFGEPAIIAVLIGVVAQIGDFTESAIKRKFGLKDSGTLLPGHGGILDRLDGYLFAAPLAAGLHYFGFFSW